VTLSCCCEGKVDIISILELEYGAFPDGKETWKPAFLKRTNTHIILG
jgi:hypothetical protein